MGGEDTQGSSWMVSVWGFIPFSEILFVMPLKILEHVFPVDKDISARTPTPAWLTVSKWKQEARHCRSHRYVCSVYCH